MHKFNWKPDLPDIRDHKYAERHMLGLAPLPSSADLRPQCSPVFDQGNIGSCTSQALAGAMEFLELRSLHDKTASAEVINPVVFNDFSRLFIYYNERMIEGNVNQDGGAQIRDGIKSLATYGDCPESLWSYSDSLLFQKPTPDAYAAGLTHLITNYSRIQSLYEMKHCLASGLPFVFGFTVYEGFESPETAKTGILHLPTNMEECLGGHAVMAVGYNDIDSTFIVRNSWGSSWGLNGYFKMPYAYITNGNLADDFWSISR